MIHVIVVVLVPTLELATVLTGLQEYCGTFWQNTAGLFGKNSQHFLAK